MRASILLLFCALALPAQDLRPKDVREIGKGGSNALPRLGELLKHPDTAIRVEAVKQITYLATALKAPRISEAAARLADQARDAGWTH